MPHVDFKNRGVNVLGGLLRTAHAIYSTTARSKLRNMVATFQPDVAHVRNIYHHLSPSILWQLKADGIPVIYHLNDFKLLCPSYNMVVRGQACERCSGGKFWHVVTEGCYAGPPGSALVLAAEAYAHRWARTYQDCVDRFLAPSRFVKAKLVENGWAEEKIDVLPHFQRLSPRVVPAPTADAPILYFGRLSAEKGITDLLQAMAHLPRIRLVIAGDGPQRGELQDLTRALHLQNVEFTGHMEVARLERLISASRFTVLPSHAYETLGKSILESYAWGRAVVASDLGSRRELIHEGETGILFPPGNVEQLAAAISLLAERPEVAAKMGESGRELVRKHHAPEDHYRKMLELYEQLRRPAGRLTKPHSPGAPRRKLRIAFIGGRGVVSKYSGIETYYEEVGERLATLGHHVTVYCRTHFTPSMKEYKSMRLVRLPTIRSKHLETVIHTFLSTLHAACNDCDIVHYQCLGPALFSFFPRLLGKKTVVTVQGLDWQRKKWGTIAEMVLRLGEWASARMPNATMVVSRTLQKYYRSLYRTETVYVPNGTSLRQKRTTIQKLAEWGLTPGGYILFLGRFSPEKNCHLLIEAYERIQTPVKLVLAGGSSHSDGYVQQLRQHESGRVKILDWVSGETLEELLSNAMLFVLPSDLEGLSLALLDAMGAGVCVLASDILENCEALEGAGFSFHRGDVHDLEQMLRLLISDSQLREMAAKLGQERARSLYLWDDVTKKVEAAYRQLLGQDATVFKGTPAIPLESDSLDRAA